MRFCDKLPQLRKSNNYSQEQLADKLNVSRQAVSKWEIGSSYPDMDKMLQMCKILNCNLEDIMDDGVIGENTANPKTNKFNINVYMKDFLNFITRSYNMFCSMNFKQKIKFLFEMACICAVLVLLGVILSSVLQSFILNMTGHSEIGWIIFSVIGNIFNVVFGIVALIVVLHLFKIRYLDYFITIEDQNAVEKTIEEPVEKKEDKYYQEKPKEKIIIRDAKHSAFKFFEVLGKIILFILKMFAVMCVIPVMIFLVICAAFVMIGLYHIPYGAIFFWAAVSFIGIGALTYLPVEWIYNFVAGKKQHLKRIFIMLIASLILTGTGVGLSISTYFSFEKSDGFLEEDYITKTETIPMNDNLIISGFPLPYEYKIDNSVDDIKLEIKLLQNMYYSIEYYDESNYTTCFIRQNFDSIDQYRLLLTDIQNKRSRNYGSVRYMKVTVIASQKNLDKLRGNRNKLQEYYDKLQQSQTDFIEPSEVFNEPADTPDEPENIDNMEY